MCININEIVKESLENYMKYKFLFIILSYRRNLFSNYL